ncbi:CoA-transferase family III domain-containing protein [Nemania sp. FL0916]|nr:CoA-transferase family III domain-containing protein [Nemania sp. FL0916]
MARDEIFCMLAPARKDGANGTGHGAPHQQASAFSVPGDVFPPTARSGPTTQPTADEALPLAGYRVLDMTRVLAGPYSTQILADLGAEVIKIEHPTRGDDTRAWGPPYAPYESGSELTGPGESAYFLGVNRNKKSLGLSFQHREGVEILHKLAPQCDILVENYLPGSLKKYDLDFETIHKINPALIYASITGYGQTGPYAQRAGYDVMVEAEFGLMHITGSRDGPPVKVGVAVTDLTTGLYTSNSIMAALLARAKTGRGQHIDVALSDCQTATLANIASSCLISGKRDTGRWGTAHPSIVPYKSFKTQDGDILFGGGNDRLFGILCDGLGKPEWKTDPRYSANSSRVAHRDELEAAIEAISIRKTTQEWLAVFEGKGMPYAAVNDVHDTLNHAHTRARDMVVELEHPDCGTIKVVNTPVKYSESKPGARTPPPTLGQHTDEVLGVLLGLDGAEIDKLKETGAVRSAGDTAAAGAGGDAAATDATPAVPATGTTSAPDLEPRGISPMVQRPYVPQFSAATQMILSRLNGKSGSLSAALASASTVARSVEKSAFEDAKRRLVMNMNTSLTMPLPSPSSTSVSAAKSAPHSSMYSSFQAQATGPATTSATTSATTKPVAAKPTGPKSIVLKQKGKAIRGTKRKRGKEIENEDESINSEMSESDSDAAAKAQTATKTKSGRQVQKPSQFNPTDARAGQKRKHWGKRTAEQALCKVCTRGLSPPKNQIVFCDGCNACWHQMCHDPYIDDEFVSDESRSWFCSGCLGRREKAMAKKKLLEEYKGVSWASKTKEQKRAYLTDIPKSQLVNIIMYSTELHPYLPIFPAPESGASSKRGASSSNAGPSTAGSSATAAAPRAADAKTQAAAPAPATFSSAVSTPDTKGSDGRRRSERKRKSSSGAQSHAERDSSPDSVPPAWPKVGQGVLAGLEMNEDDLRDDNDYEAFSVTSYDGKGRKIMENGKPV